MDDEWDDYFWGDITQEQMDERELMYQAFKARFLSEQLADKLRVKTPEDLMILKNQAE